MDASLSPAQSPARLEDLGELPNDALLTVLDRQHCNESRLSVVQRHWRDNGYVTLERFLPEELMRAYSRLREQKQHPEGWGCPTPYMYFKEIRDLTLYKPLMQVLESLIGDRVGLHLNLTGWVSTNRDWHQDDYLNPPFINSWYAAVWMALDSIHPDSGPFEFVPGSHRWPLLRRDLVWNRMDKAETLRPDWPATSERIVVPAFEEYIARSGAKVERFLGKRGDVLIWHGRLAHRGSRPKDPTLMRKALISHYSSLTKRTDFPHRAKWKNGEWYFIHHCPLDGDVPKPNLSPDKPGLLERLRQRLPFG